MARSNRTAGSAARRASGPVVIIGGGFGGLACAKRLGAPGVETVLIDRHNYHLFVPLLYQVATAALSPADIAQPIRRILRRHGSVSVRLAEVSGIDAGRGEVALSDGGRIPYRCLVIAAGSVCNYFGHDDWAAHAPCPRDLPDATALRSRILMALERAEQCADADRRAAYLTFVIVGGGPTGVEMAGAVAELTRHALRREFRSIDPALARIVLVEAGPRVLSNFPEALSQDAARRLDALSVAVITGRAVRAISERGVDLDGEFLPSDTVVWGAGTRAAPAAGWLGTSPPAPGGRIPVGPDLAIEGHSGIYAIGDVAACPGEDGRLLPALAQVAKQQGDHLGLALARECEDGSPVPAFRFRNRGNTAIIGRNAAVFDFGGGRTLTGRPAWLLWALVHIYLLNGLERRFLVATQWLVRYVTRQRGARLITEAPPDPLSAAAASPRRTLLSGE